MSTHYLNLGSTIRECSPQQTLAKLESLLDSFGITRVANITGLDDIGIPVAVAIRPNAQHVTVSQGKGNNWELAKISAIMESIETFHAETPKAIDVFGSYHQLKSNHKIVLPHFHQHQFFQHPDMANLALPWVYVESLFSGEKILYPYYLFLLGQHADQQHQLLFNANTNGLASGNTKPEAICHGLYELIERDALFSWGKLSQQQKQNTLINPNTIEDKINQGLINQITTAGYQIKIWDITGNVAIPSFRCAIFNTDLFRQTDVNYGSGTHLNKHIALARAITEAAQTRLTLISGSRDDIFPGHYHRDSSFSIDKVLSSSDTEKSFHAVNQPSFKPDWKDNIDFILSTLQQRDINEVVFFDHTDTTPFSIPVVHIYSPNLHFSGERQIHE